MESLWFRGDNFTSDVALFTKEKDKYFVALVVRKNDPFKGMHTLPGGFIKSLSSKGDKFIPSETPLEAAIRELKEETNYSSVLDLKPIGVYDEPGRDPRAKGDQKVISYAFSAIAKNAEKLKAGDDAKSVEWIPLDDVLTGRIKLAFDHLKIINDSIIKLKIKHG